MTIQVRWKQVTTSDIQIQYYSFFFIERLFLTDAAEGMGKIKLIGPVSFVRARVCVCRGGGGVWEGVDKYVSLGCRWVSIHCSVGRLTDPCSVVDAGTNWVGSTDLHTLRKHANQCWYSSFFTDTFALEKIITAKPKASAITSWRVSHGSAMKTISQVLKKI